MSSYFDAVASSIRSVSMEYTTDNLRRLQAIEESLVFDVSVCIQFPGFPAGVVPSVLTAILNFGIHTLPDNAPPGRLG